MPFDPGGDVDKQGKAGGVGFGEAIAAKAADLLVQPFGEVGIVTTFEHTGD